MPVNPKIKDRLKRERVWTQYWRRRRQLKQSGVVPASKCNAYTYIDFLPLDGVPDNCALVVGRGRGDRSWASNDLESSLDPELVERVRAMPYRLCVGRSGVLGPRTLRSDGSRVSAAEERLIRDREIDRGVQQRIAGQSERVRGGLFLDD